MARLCCWGVEKRLTSSLSVSLLKEYMGTTRHANEIWARKKGNFLFVEREVPNPSALGISWRWRTRANIKAFKKVINLAALSGKKYALEMLNLVENSAMDSRVGTKRRENWSRTSNIRRWMRSRKPFEIGFKTIIEKCFLTRRIENKPIAKTIQYLSLMGCHFCQMRPHSAIAFGMIAAMTWNENRMWVSCPKKRVLLNDDGHCSIEGELQVSLCSFYHHMYIHGNYAKTAQIHHAQRDQERLEDVVDFSPPCGVPFL